MVIKKWPSDLKITSLNRIENMLINNCGKNCFIGYKNRKRKMWGKMNNMMKNVISC